MARAYMEEITVSVTDLAEVRALRRAAAVLLATLGERGVLRSYDREAADLWTAIAEIDRRYPRITEEDE